MNKMFDGRAIQEEILKELAKKISQMAKKPTLAVLLIGDDPVCRQYVELKKKMAEKIGIQFCLYCFDEKDEESEIIEAIEFLNNDPEIDGIMIQIPVAKKFDRNRLIEAISPKKDVDGLRYCAGLDSDYRPPVVEAILHAIKQSQKDLCKSNVLVIGRGFLVGEPLIRDLIELGTKPNIVTSETCKIGGNPHEKLAEAVSAADIIISATGCPGIVEKSMVSDGAILIDAGTAEENGQIKGDVSPDAYDQASYYTPVPGGIGPVTVAMLFSNLIK